MCNNTATTDHSGMANNEEHQDTEEQQCRFLSLPAELRNMTYKFALIEVNGIDLIPALKPPGLLATNHQIRQESLQIWYIENDFPVHVYECDISLIYALEKHACMVGQVPITHVYYAWQLTDVGWDNLMVWCRYIYEGEMP